MKAILISIQPKWCELIASGKKTVEVRKTKPKLETPFKCYIYCTKAKEHFSIGGGLYATSDTLYRLPTGEIKFGDGFELMGDWSGEYDENNFLNGKVIGEFVCDKIIDIPYSQYFVDYYHTMPQEELKVTCLDMGHIDEYLLSKNGYGWHISNLVIYDKPKELTEFKKAGFMTEENWLAALYPNTHCHYEAWAKKFDIARPPQSWCYIESEG